MYCSNHRFLSILFLFLFCSCASFHQEKAEYTKSDFVDLKSAPKYALPSSGVYNYELFDVGESFEQPFATSKKEPFIRNIHTIYDPSIEQQPSEALNFSLPTMNDSLPGKQINIPNLKVFKMIDQNGIENFGYQAIGGMNKKKVIVLGTDYWMYLDIFLFVMFFISILTGVVSILGAALHLASVSLFGWSLSTWLWILAASIIAFIPGFIRVLEIRKYGMI